MGDALVHDIRFTLNGREEKHTVPSRQLLVHLLRDEIGLRGPKVGCDTGNCGACTVRVDGEVVKGCMMLAPQADGCEIETAESLAPDADNLSALQQAFHEEHALQCGYCTSGVLMSVSSLLERNPEPDEHDVRKALKGNICRCTGYMNIVRAVEALVGANGSGEEASR